MTGRSTWPPPRDADGLEDRIAKLTAALNQAVEWLEHYDCDIEAAHIRELLK